MDIGPVRRRFTAEPVDPPVPGAAVPVPEIVVATASPTPEPSDDGSVVGPRA